MGTINRPDGTIQKADAERLRPVYTAGGDPQPGATAGQGINSGEWAAVTPDRQKAARQRLMADND